MLYRAIRIFRIVFSLAFMAMVVAAAFLPSAHAQRLAHFLAHMEIVPALLTAGGLWVSAWAVITLLFGRIYCSSICLWARCRMWCRAWPLGVSRGRSTATATATTGPCSVY